MSSDIQFCKVCRNVLHPEEDKYAKKLMWICRTCNEVVVASQHSQVQNLVDTVNLNFRSAEDVKKYILPGLDKDPTLPRSHDWVCPNCQVTGAVYFQLPERVADDAMTLVYVCSTCSLYEVHGKVNEDGSPNLETGKALGFDD